MNSLRCVGSVIAVDDLIENADDESNPVSGNCSTSSDPQSWCSESWICKSSACPWMKNPFRGEMRQLVICSVFSFLYSCIWNILITYKILSLKPSQFNCTILSWWAIPQDSIIYITLHYIIRRFQTNFVAMSERLFFTFLCVHMA